MDRRQFLSATLLAPAMAGRSRLRTAICAYSFRSELQAKTMTYEDLVRRAVDWDVDGLDLTVYWFPSTSDEFLLPLRRLAYKLGVEIYQHLGSDRVDQTLARRPHQRSARHLPLGRCGERSGCGSYPCVRRCGSQGVTEEQATPWVTECLLRASDYAGRKGIILGLENHGGITLRAERIVEIVRKVDSPWVGINLDTGNFRSQVFQQIEMCLPYAVNFQVKPKWRMILGR